MADLDAILSYINGGYQSVTNLIPEKFNFVDDPYLYDDGEGYSFIINCTGLDWYPIALAVAIQDDGKVLVGGNRYDKIEDNYYGRLKRYNTDGTVDNTFTSVSFSGDIYAIKLQSTGKIIVGGYFGDGVDGYNYYGLVRLNTDGTVDDSFNEVTSGGDEVYALAIDPNDDSILFGGYVSDYLQKTDIDGIIDSDFASNISGVLDSPPKTMALDSNLDLVVGGEFTNGIIKIKTTGTNLQRGTAVGTFTASSFNDYVYSVAIQIDDKIIVGGRFTDYGGDSANRIVRLNSDGTLDNTFSYYGTFESDYNTPSIYAVAIQSDGKIVLAGDFTLQDAQHPLRIDRVTSSGSSDTTLNVGYSFNDQIMCMALDGSNNIYVGGYFGQYNGRTLSSTFNFGCEQLSFGFAKLSNTGSIAGNPFRSSYYTAGIDDGGNDLYDQGNYLNTNLTQTYAQILDFDRNNENCIPYTHSASLSDNGADDSYYDTTVGYGHIDKTPKDGIVADGSDYFGSGSKYFTNLYPGLFVMGAKDISIDEFNVTGGTGQDYSGGVDNGYTQIEINGESWACFYRSSYGVYAGTPGDPNDPGEAALNHIIIVKGTATGITQDIGGDSNNSDDHVLTGLTGRSELYLLVFARLDGIASTPTEISAIAKKFLNLFVGAEVTKTCGNQGCGTQKGKVCLFNNSCTCAKWKFFTAQCSRNQQALGLCSGTSGAYVPAITVCNQRLF